MPYSAKKRRQYQRDYYEQNKEKVREYQRLYYHTHKKKMRGENGESDFMCPRESTRSTFHSVDLMRAPAEKSVRMLNQIISGERTFII